MVVIFIHVQVQLVGAARKKIMNQELRVKNKGFTLIELVVSMAIIAILAAAGLSSFTTSQIKGRDGRRKSDLTQFSRALELYYNDYGQYPTGTNGLIMSCGGTCSGACNWGGGPFCSSRNTATIYMQTLPKDPSSTSRQYYYSSPDGTTYALYSWLENNNDAAIITPAVTADCDAGAGTGCSYGISSSNTKP